MSDIILLTSDDSSDSDWHDMLSGTIMKKHVNTNSITSIDISELAISTVGQMVVVSTSMVLNGKLEEDVMKIIGLVREKIGRKVPVIIMDKDSSPLSSGLWTDFVDLFVISFGLKRLPESIARIEKMMIEL